MAELLTAYRQSWRSAGHRGEGKVMLDFHMYCAETREEAVRVARDPLNRYLRSIADACADWAKGASLKNYPGYDKMVERLQKETFESQVASHSAFVGTPDQLIAAISEYDQAVGGIDVASLQVNFNTIGYDDAARSMKLFGEKVIPRFRAKAHAAE
jgi:alkanesulfonate monooxygenase SsuD/methylene tetrahydromethanopterin reductase-like flavin-dependent oxidoreductase (luciferase family)